MFHVTAVAEDTTLIISESEPLISDPRCPKCRRSLPALTPTPTLNVVAIDSLTGKTHTATMTYLQVGAVLALMYGGEDYGPEATTALYAIAESAVAGFPSECRPIP